MKPSTRTRRDSLVRQATEERLQNEGLKRQNTLKHRKRLESEHGAQILKKLNDEGVEVIWSSRNERPNMKFAAIIATHGDSKHLIVDLVNALDENGIQLKRLETRPVKLEVDHQPVDDHPNLPNGEDVGEKFEILFEGDATKNAFIEAANCLSTKHRLSRLDLFKADAATDVPWFPKHVSELDRCTQVVTKYEPTSDPRHPGYGDTEYINRRHQINQTAIQYRHGDHLPFVEYTAAEHQTWNTVYLKMKALHLSHTCQEYRRNLAMMERDGILSPDRIPQLDTVSQYLQRKSGFTLRPCGGLLSARDFLASLAFRVFQATQYVRHPGSPHHSPEPDLIHELLGHCPMFADPIMAQFSQEIGLISLGASDEQIEQLATVYWFIIEFGLCREEGQLKAIGAGLLSAYGELLHACSDTPQHQDFDPHITAMQKYEDSDYQPLYFVAASINDAMNKLRHYARAMKRPFSVIYDPITRSVLPVETMAELGEAVNRFRFDLANLTDVLEQITGRTKE